MVTKMQTLSLSPEHYLQIGPRQGVHIHPVQWRRTQFRDPTDCYHYRARIEPGPRATESSSQTANRQTSNTNHRSSASCPALPVLRGSSTISSDQRKQTGAEAEAKLSLTAHALVIQPRPPPRPPTTPKTTEIQSQPYSYPDFRKIKGDVSFDVRLLELSKLESETVRSEELKKRLANRARVATSVALARQQNPQPQVSRGSPNRASVTGIPDRRPRSATLLGRKSSLPASIGYTYDELRYSREADKLDQQSSYKNVSNSRSFLNKEDTSNPIIPRRRPRSANASPDPEANVQSKLTSPSQLMATVPIAEEEESTTNSNICLDSNPKETATLHSAVKTATLDQGAKTSTVPPSNSPTSSDMTHLSVSCNSKHEFQDSVTFCPGSSELQTSNGAMGLVGNNESERPSRATADPPPEDMIKIEDIESVIEKGEKVVDEAEERKEEKIEERKSMLDLGNQSQEAGFPAKVDGKIDSRESDSSTCQQKIGQAEKRNANGKHTKQRKKQKSMKKKISSSKSATHLDQRPTLKSSDSTSSLRLSKSKKSSHKIERKVD